MHLQEIFDLQGLKHFHLHHATYVPAKFEVATANGYQENTLFDLDPKVKGSRSHEMLPSTLDIM